jgi:O-antigen/teichoic acid export membrane protein
MRRGEIPAKFDCWDRSLWTQQVRVGRRAYVACVASFVVSRLPLYAVGARGGLDGTAYFTQALVIADTILVVPSALGSVLFPNLAAARDVNERVRATLKLAGVTTGLLAIAVIGTIVFGPIVLPMVYGKAYSASMPLLMALLPGIVALGLCSVSQNALSANGYPWAAVFSPISGVVTVAIVLTQTNSVAGCAWAYSVGGLVMLITSAVAWWFHRHDHGDAHELPDPLAHLPDA